MNRHSKTAAVTLRDAWRTPDDLYRDLDRRFKFAWDLAADATNTKSKNYLDAARDSLSIDWSKLRPPGAMFCNPPFSKLKEFTAKAAASFDQCKSPIVMLIPGHRHEQGWFHHYILGVAAEILIPKGRVAYIPPNGVKSSSPSFPSMVIVYARVSRRMTVIRSL